MLVMRLQRVGKKGQPSYRLVVAERRSKLTASPVEDLGAYSITTKTATFNKDRITHWLSQGVQPSVTVHNLLVREKIVNAPKIQLNIKVAPKAETPVEESAPASAAPVAASQEPAPITTESSTEEAPKEEAPKEEATA